MFNRRKTPSKIVCFQINLWNDAKYFFFAVQPQEHEPEDIDRKKYEVKEIVSTNKFIAKFDEVKLLYMYSTA